MDVIKTFFDVFGFGESTFGRFLFQTFCLLAMVIAVWTLIQKVSVLIGKPVGVARQRKMDHSIIIEMEKKIANLEEQQNTDRTNSIEHDKKIQKRQDDIYKLLLDTRIDSMRSEIINFAAQISSGMKFHKDAFDHIYQVHGKYEKLLEDNGLKNGVMQASMKIINEKFQELIGKI